jgi:hypothetical protein
VDPVALGLAAHDDQRAVTQQYVAPLAGALVHEGELAGGTRVMTTPPVTALDYSTVRSHTLRLAAPLSPEDCMVQSMPDASPV